ncbi:MAG: triose-phosphate isomerase [Negativicutes bacterium]|jgi:triosephosphate isomerase
MRTPIIAGNWKMHKTVAETKATVKALAALVADVKNVEIVVCPPFTALAAAAEAACCTNIAIGSQNIFWEEKGAFTGEIAPNMLVEAGCKYAVVGHSERRQYFGETDETVNKRVKAALKHNLIPILCVGETLAQREAGITQEICATQTRGGLSGLTAEEVAGLVIAYEPVWAIGTGKTATSKDANDVCAFIRREVATVFGQTAADAVRVQYGGSVKADNASELMAMSDIDGALVGGASLNAEDFAKIVKF